MNNRAGCQEYSLESFAEDSFGREPAQDVRGLLMQLLPVFVLQHASDVEHFVSDVLMRYLVFGEPCRGESP